MTERPHVHGPDCKHEHEPAPAEAKPHVHGPDCKHGHEHEEKKPHSHGPDCKHGHEHEEKKPHVHGPDCKHGHEHEEKKPHVHGPDCKHGHDDHAGHDHGGHVHGPGCDHGHDDHAGHDHHGHHHAPKKERAAGTRPAETDGGPAVQLDLDFILTGEKDEQGRFARLEELLRAHHGVREAHLRNDGTHRELCVHFDANKISVAEVLAYARATGSKAAKRYLAKTWFIRGMDAAQNAATIEHGLRKVPGILQADVAYAAERLVVEFDREGIAPKEIETEVARLGYALEEPSHGHACSHSAHGSGLAPKLEVPFAITAVTCLAGGLLLEKLGGFSPMVSNALWAVSIATGGFFAAKGALGSLKQLKVDIESLMVLAALGAAALGAWFEGAFLLVLFSIGHAIEHRAMDSARRNIEALGKLRPEKARVKRGEAWVEVDVSDVLRHDRVMVRPGDRVPLDGIIREGRSSLEQAAITGESVPVARGPGDEVFAGSVNTEAALQIEVSRLSSESVLAKVVDLVVEAEARKSPAQRFAQKVEQRFVPIVLVLAVLLPVALIAMGTGAKDALLRAVALLVAASPCALAISTPAAVLSAVAAAARGGVLIKGGVHLEALGHIKAIAFDKTGTLTHGKPRVVSVEAFEGTTVEQLLQVAAGAESLSAHPLALAVVAAAKEKNVSPAEAKDLKAIHGKGLEALVAGVPTRIGSLALFETPPAHVKAKVEELEAKGQTTMVVEQGGRWLGVFGVADTLRTETRGAIEALAKLGIVKMVMLSGDNATVAKAIGAQAGVTEVQAPLMPAGKVEALKVLSKTMPVAMVGDGVNDAPALAAASVGIAMGGAGSDVALETADVVLMSDDLNKLPFALGLARKATAVINQNLVISIGVAAVLIVASLAGWAKVSEAVVFHEGSTLLVLFNGLRLLRYR